MAGKNNDLKYEGKKQVCCAIDGKTSKPVLFSSDFAVPSVSIEDSTGCTI